MQERPRLPDNPGSPDCECVCHFVPGVHHLTACCFVAQDSDFSVSMSLPPLRIMPLANLYDAPDLVFDLDTELSPLAGPYIYQGFESTESSPEVQRIVRENTDRLCEAFKRHFEGLTNDMFLGLSGIVVPNDTHVTYIEAEYRVVESTTEAARKWAEATYERLYREAILHRAARQVHRSN